MEKKVVYLTGRPRKATRQLKKFHNHGVEWTWDNSLTNEFIDLVNDDRDANFHRNFSTGTAVVRGTQPMLRDQHFWEVEMTSAVYGTDMMIGVGTSEADVSQVHDRFISFLGMNNYTWGLSYTGMFHHNGECKYYTSRFGQGSIIGVHLDMWNGTLSYYKNKKYLGIASRGLKGKTLYAMASSTAACSGMRIITSSSFPSSLQFLCCARLRDLIPDKKNVIAELTLPPGLRLFLENNLSWFLNDRSTEKIFRHESVPILKRRHGTDEGDGSYESFLQNYVFERNLYEEEDIGSTSSTPGLVGNFVILSNGPFVFCSCNRFQRNVASTSRESHGNCIPGHDDHSADKNANPNCSTDRVSTKEELDESFEVHPSTESPLGSEESETKRQRCSYNYLVGLSDPDSD